MNENVPSLESSNTISSGVAAGCEAEPVQVHPAMVTCLDCGVEHQADKECWICGPVSRAFVNFRKNKREYAMTMSASREEG
jgi:hypothetical protein